MGCFEPAAAVGFRWPATRTYAITQSRSRARTPATLLVVLSAALTLLLPSSAFALPEQGIYYGCGTGCEAGLDAARAAGLNFRHHAAVAVRGRRAPGARHVSVLGRLLSRPATGLYPGVRRPPSHPRLVRGR